jgi:hypothetical protein
MAEEMHKSDSPETGKLPADKKLIKRLFKIKPMDWARRPDGSLVFIAPNGAKYRYTREQLQELASAAEAEGDTNSETYPEGTE